MKISQDKNRLFNGFKTSPQSNKSEAIFIYPTVVMDTHAHQKPSQTPDPHLAGNSPVLDNFSCVRVEGADEIDATDHYYLQDVVIISSINVVFRRKHIVDSKIIIYFN